MRIGVHTGMVLSGLLGLKKWQYDIWSLDSMKASQMEHDGKPGYVHVTKTTLDLVPKQLRTEFYIQGLQTLHTSEQLVSQLICESLEVY